MNSSPDVRLRHLFEPRGVIVIGASSHPAKFGFVALHNLLAAGFAGTVFAVNRDGGEILGLATATDVEELPSGEADLALVCTPAGANPDVLRACAAKGVKAAYVVSGGYREAGPEGRRAEEELVALADKLDIVLAGPNGQGLVSTPAGLCAQIVGPYPVAGSISIASQSGNTTSSFMNYANQSGVGIARAVSAGNAAAVTVTDYLRWYRDDDATRVAFAYLEHSADGRAVFDGLRAVTAEKPVVLVKGGVTGAGQQAAASHTGALAGEHRIFAGAVRQAGVSLAATVEEAFDVAATFATQPLPKGPNTVVVTTAGGWGVMTADALAASSLRLMPLPDDLRAAIDTRLPPRWSRANPVDMAGGESRDTVPEVLELVAAHPAVDAVVYLGLGIQSNSAGLLRDGRFYPDHGLERIVAFHERQDRRFADAAAAASAATGKPVLTATELGVTDPSNPGPAAVRET
ncbi:MAG: acetate---CoA ligase (ADP-forming) subunit alpha, partial [Actinomycetota bacterium]|nr:acetate---CoA ligase (ADP-forming) subunit alpha [Actinomycetota bacterium]